jgi:hypothetical protein
MSYPVRALLVFQHLLQGHAECAPVVTILVVAGLINVAIYELWARRTVAHLAPGAAMPAPAKAAGLLSLGIWVAVAACGRSIAYF